MLDKLKSCPFCGSDAETYEEEFSCVVACASDSECNARVSAIDEVKAIAKWNNRVTQE